MTDKTKPPEQIGPSQGSGARWAQRVWPDGGSVVLLPLERLEDQMHAEDIERFLELERHGAVPEPD